ncbi:MAG: hypothetical protein MJ238_00250 [Bacilli bacterium]|nr:hypothetical protein [Bacilli bacterium]
MKRMLSKICYIASASLISIGSFAFLAVNLRGFFAFDWLVFSDPVYGCIAGLSKIILWSIGVASLPLTIIHIKKNTPSLRMAMMIYALSLFIAGVVMALIFKTSEGIAPLYYIIPVALIPVIYVLCNYFFEANNK